MPIITTIEEVRANGVKVNFINEDGEIADMTAAELMFIKPVLGMELYKEVLETPADFADLIPYIKRALAPLAYWLDLGTIQTQITDKGIATSDSNNMTAAHRWEYEALKDNLEIKGCFGLETLIEFLSVPEISAAYEWQLPDEYNLIFKTGKEFSNYFRIHQPYRTYLSLRPVLKTVEDEYIRATISDEFFEEMRDIVLPEKKTERNDVQEKQFKALQLIKKSAAYLTIAKAVDLLPVRISNEGFTAALASSQEEPNPKNQNAPNVQLYSLQTSAQKSGEKYLTDLTDFLNKNASDSLFATYKNSTHYTAPVTTAPVDPNSTQNIFTL